MPRKNTNARPRVLRAVPDPAIRTTAEDKLWAALRAHPASTAADLAAVAGIGRSTAGKILTGWQHEGCVSRTSPPAQGGRRVGDTWTIADLAPAAAVSDGADAAAGGEPEPEEDSAAPDAVGGGVTGGVVNAEDTAPQPPPGIALSGAADSGAVGGGEHDARPTTTAAGALGDDGAGGGPVGARAVSGEALAEPAASGRGPRLAKGALHGLVEDFLSEHPGEAFGPSAIGKALGRSSGAVANALDRLVEKKVAVLTSEKPRRFTSTAE